MAKDTVFEFPPGGHVGLLIWDSVNEDWYAVLGDADGHIHLDVLTSALPTGAATAAKQDTAITALEKLDDLQGALADVGADELRVNIISIPTTTVIPDTDEKIVGYGGVIGENVSDENLSSGNSNLDTTAVPSDEVYVVTAISAKYVGTSPTLINAYTSGTPGTPTLLFKTSPTSGTWYHEKVFVVLAEGDKIRCRVEGATAGDDLFFRYVGYKFAAP